LGVTAQTVVMVLMALLDRPALSVLLERTDATLTSSSFYLRCKRPLRKKLQNLCYRKTVRRDVMAKTVSTASTVRVALRVRWGLLDLMALLVRLALPVLSGLTEIPDGMGRKDVKESPVLPDLVVLSVRRFLCGWFQSPKSLLLGNPLLCLTAV
jgi:hypothetical protein